MSSTSAVDIRTQAVSPAVDLGGGAGAGAAAAAGAGAVGAVWREGGRHAHEREARSSKSVIATVS